MNILNISQNEFYIYAFQKDGCYVIPPHYMPSEVDGDSVLWLLPKNEESNSRFFLCGKYRIETKGNASAITFFENYSERELPGVPCCDFFGNEMIFDIEHKEMFEKCLSKFYWLNLLNQTAERTFMADKKDIRDGYVLSTLNKKAYAGTYPAVDHEFHIKGRFAAGGEFEKALIKRMLLLQLKIMREDKKKLFRNVCSVQPGGRREYRVWRRSKNLINKAQMFRVTGNAEFTEELYSYYSLTKDRDFLCSVIEDAEKCCSYIERFLGKNGLLNSHVYYEDQVIKNGPVLQAQMLVSNSFRLMSEMEGLLGKKDMEKYYSHLWLTMGENAVRDYPLGFWDRENMRFTDWIDKKGRKHDHIHLLANRLPILFGFADKNQEKCCIETIDRYSGVFDKFPSFVAAETENYTNSEIGTGGPYDLCAAGRYWCWDAEYLAFKRDGNKLLNQLLQVSRQAEKDGFFMGERYDMNHVYYNTGENAKKNWHGASLYYEYPNVWIYVFICKYIGIRRGFKEDLIIDPLFEKGSVTLEQYGVCFKTENYRLTYLKNICSEKLRVYLPSYKKSCFLSPGESAFFKEASI